MDAARVGIAVSAKQESLVHRKGDGDAATFTKKEKKGVL
jgi:hypothetical protein